MTTPRLRDDLGLALHYDDRTAYGSGVTGLLDRLLQRSTRAIAAVAAERGIEAVQAQAPAWMPTVMGPKGLGSLYAREGALREEVLYPDVARVTPATLGLYGLGDDGQGTATIPLEPALVPELGRWIGDFARGSARPSAPAAARLWDALDARGALARASSPGCALKDGVTFVGHACVAFARRGARIVFDPFLLPPSPQDPAGMRPLTAAELAPDAVFITHAHPDHFDVATLMRLGVDTPIYVPAVARETLLATDMVYRLRELGFTQVHALRWYQEVTIGPFRVIALPFYGEQPTDGEILHPEARNLGNTYVVECEGQRHALVADAGRDAAGDTIELAAEARRRFGTIDALFGGYRAWRLQPLQYLLTSVARYLLFVPRDQWTRWQQIMNDAGDLVATAEAWGARAVVPYANGGAPWYARIGLGPHGDPERPDDPDFDPGLDAVAAAIERRASGVRMQAMACGEHRPFQGA
ncbi:MAG: MBL fold metallo-hydrolase [Nannocystaceae bacterium]